MDLRNKQILVAGLGRTGVSVTRFLARHGARVTVTDAAPAASLREGLSMLSGLDVDFVLGRQDAGVFETADLVVLSPGVPHTIGPVVQAAEKGIPVIGEIELAARFIKAPILAVTGTNGKTTTTTLLAGMLKHSGFSVFVGGNIGTPMTDYLNNNESAEFVVTEVSSFQLDTIERFRPKAAVLLNITDDHLDRYPDFESYARSKARVFMNQGPSDIAVINAADPVVQSVARGVKSRQFFYNAEKPVKNGAWISGTTIYFSIPGQDTPPIDCKEIPLAGRHNLENVSAAALTTLSLGGSIKGIEATLRVFRGLPHRMAYVAERNGIRFYDDSKATNADAVARALESFSSPVVLIMGGRDKGGSYEGLRPRLKRVAKHIVVMGEAAERITGALADIVPVSRVSSMQEAVRSAFEAADPGDSVLLSPACSSFDMYESYARRGEDFVRAVNELTGVSA